MSDQPITRAGVLGEAATAIQKLAGQRFDQYGSSDVRGAAFWDAACYLVEQLSDGDWRTDAERQAAPTGLPAPARTSGHWCANCDGVAVGSCAFNPNRHVDDAVERATATEE